MRGVIRPALIVAAMIVALGLGGCDDRKAEVRSTSAGTPAPELVATTLDGRVVRLADLRGKVVLINFWLNGCGPCLAEMSDIDAYYRENRDKGLEVLAINMGQPKEVAVSAAVRLDVSFPLLVDPLRITSDRYKVNAAPTFFIVDAKGDLVERVDGPLDKKVLAAKLDSLL